MDGRIFALFAAAIVTLAGAITAIVVLKPVDTESDYNLLEKVGDGNVDADLFYSYERESDSYTHYKSLNVQEVDETGIVTAYRSEHEVMTNTSKTFDLDDFMEVLFDFTDEDEVPSGITVDSAQVGLTTEYIYTISGTGSIDTGSVFTGRKEMTCTFTDFEIDLDTSTETVNSISGTVQFDGSRNTTVPNQYFMYNDVTYRFTELLGVPSFTVSGQVTSEGTWIYLTKSDFADELETYYPPYSAIEKSEEYVYAGCECTQYILNGTASSTGDVYKDTIAYITTSGYIIKLKGTINDEEVSINTEIYYQSF